jgi:peptidoglycan/LPS O-acetylase OafA/YrhL
MGRRTPARGEPRLGHRPALDGLRALAVTFVVVSHVFTDRFPALGATGVLVFFVLSGYLITWVLVEDRERRGRLDLRKFYARRAARLLPALLSVLVATPLLYLVTDDMQRLRSAGQEVLAAGFYVMDFVHMHRAVPGLLAPTWSLGVEEQFYLVWPLLLGLILLRGRRVVPWVAVLFVLAAAWTLTMTGVMSMRPDAPANYWRVQYGPDTQASSLLAGCLLAVVERRHGLPRVPPRVVSLCLVGLCVIGFCPSTLGIPSMVLWTHLPTVALTVVVLIGRGVADGDVLARRLPVWVGQRSYGIYLWHFLFVGLVVFGTPLDTTGRVAGALLGVAVAAASYRWLEKPVRDRVRARTAPGDRVPAPVRPADWAQQTGTPHVEQPVRRGSSGS